MSGPVHELQATLTTKQRNATTEAMDAAIAAGRVAGGPADTEKALTWMESTGTFTADEIAAVAALKDADLALVAACRSVAGAADEVVAACGPAVAMAVRHVTIAAQNAAGDPYGAQTGPVPAGGTPAGSATSAGAAATPTYDPTIGVRTDDGSTRCPRCGYGDAMGNPIGTPGKNHCIFTRCGRCGRINGPAKMWTSCCPHCRGGDDMLYDADKDDPDGPPDPGQCGAAASDAPHPFVQVAHTGPRDGYFYQWGECGRPDDDEIHDLPAAEQKPVPDKPAKAVKDPLRVGNRIVLGEGEAFAGSAAAKSEDMGVSLLAAGVDTPDGRVVHVAVPVLDDERKNWKGANAPAEETYVDDEEYDADADPSEYTHTVETYADVTAVIDGADAAKLPGQVDEAIATAKEIDRQFKADVRVQDRLYAERSKLQARRFGDADRAKEWESHTGWQRSHEDSQKRRRATMDEVREHLSEEDRARYDAVQERIDEAGQDRFEAGKEEQAAATYGWTVDEYREAVELQKIGHFKWTREQRDRWWELNPDRKPDLLAEQAAIVHGVTVDEYREYERLDEMSPPLTPDSWPRDTRRPRRTPDEQARYEELRDAPGGATAATQAKTRKMRNQFDTTQSAHHSDKVDLVALDEQIAAVEVHAGTLDPADAARLAQVEVELDAVGDKLAVGGETTAKIEVPGRNGATLVVSAIQGEEEGGVDYEFDVRPAGADSEEWYAANGNDPYRTDAAGARKAAKAIAGLAGEQSEAA